MSRRKVVRGRNVYVDSPQKLVPDCVSITGDVLKVTNKPSGKWAVVRGYVAKMGGGQDVELAIRYELLGVRIGTPISQISTQPGKAGYAEWCRISRSWGY
jgi:hypothetical protein